MKTTLEKCDAVLEPELRELCGELNAVDRAKTAEKFARWVDQLTESAVLMDPKLVPAAPPPKVPRGFVLVNLATRQQDELRELAQECGVSLRGVLRWAITTTKIQLQDQVKLARLCGVSPWRCREFIFGDKDN